MPRGFYFRRMRNTANCQWSSYLATLNFKRMHISVTMATSNGFMKKEIEVMTLL